MSLDPVDGPQSKNQRGRSREASNPRQINMQNPNQQMFGNMNPNNPFNSYQQNMNHQNMDINDQINNLNLNQNYMPQP